MIDLEKEIENAFVKYGSQVKGVLKTKSDKVAKGTVKELKSTSPKKSGNYAKTWTSKKNSNSVSYSNIVHNDKNYRLTHLLENGHATRKGGRTRAFPHIKQAEEKAIKSFEKEVKQEIEKL
ncbi:MAG: HK97 gp10 family phage protein [Peptostreptococcaceae bacterium]|nr:HK97 gp10 family phage protein [Peptostreptococcaceae bacterium]